MNKERLLAVANLIEKGQHKFNGIHAAFKMSNWFNTVRNESGPFDKDNFVEYNVPKRDDITDPYACNTVACIAGFTCLLFDYEEMKKLRSSISIDKKIEKDAAHYLDLNDTEAYELFVSHPHSSITGKEAAKVIRNFVDTGEIDWTILDRFK